VDDAKLFETREELLTKINTLERRIDAVSVEKDDAVWKAKFILSGVIAAISFAGYLGIHYSYQDLKNSFVQRVDDELRQGVISEDRAFYRNLMTGSALNTGQRYSAATARLLQCFTEGHYNDSAVLIPLLDSIYRNDDWVSAGKVITVLTKNDPEYERIGDATVLAYIGGTEVQASVDHPEWLETGFSVLKKAQALTTPGDSGTLGVVYMNYWVYYLQHHDMLKAADTINSMKQQSLSVNSWSTVRQWKFFERYFADEQNRRLEPQIKAMWQQLSNRYSADRP
jgi:hypothetical protein